MCRLTPNFDRINLDNKQKVLEFYQGLNGEEKLSLRALQMKLRGNNALKHVYQYTDALIPLSNRIVPLEFLIKSIINIEDYNKEHEEGKIAKDKKRPTVQDNMLANYRYINKFADYKLLIKDFNKKYKSCSEWVDKFFDIVEKNIDISVETAINKESIYYKASKELAKALSKLWFVKKVILFGSVARGQEKEGSDIDIAYEIGINPKKLTKTRLGSLNKIVQNTILPIELKYKDIIKSTKNIDIMTGQPKVFNLMCLSTQKKSAKDWYDKSHFFDNAVTLLERDRFMLKGLKTEVQVRYDDLQYVIFTTYSTDSYFLWKEKINENNKIFEIGKYDCDKLEYIGELEIKSWDGRYSRLKLNIKEDIENKYDSYVEKTEYVGDYYTHTYTVFYSLERETNSLRYEFEKNGVRSAK